MCYKFIAIKVIKRNIKVNALGKLKKINRQNIKKQFLKKAHDTLVWQQINNQWTEY